MEKLDGITDINIYQMIFGWQFCPQAQPQIHSTFKDNLCPESLLKRGHADEGYTHMLLFIHDKS